MVLEASRQHSQALHNSSDPAFRNPHALRAQEKEKSCDHCGNSSHSSDSCFTKFPHLAPDWFKEMIKEKAKGTGKSAERARKFQAKVAMVSRDDDFTDNHGTYISC